MSGHLERKRFVSCFIESSKVFINQNAGKFLISEEFDQEGFQNLCFLIKSDLDMVDMRLCGPKKCSLLAASSIDEYFEAVIDFVNWLYADCGNSTTGQGSPDIHTWTSSRPQTGMNVFVDLSKEKLYLKRFLVAFKNDGIV